MGDRKRRRTIIGYTATACPHCGHGSLVLTASQFRRRLRDALNPRFDPKVLYREVCTHCKMRYTISQAGPSARASESPATPAPLFGGAESAGAEPEAPVRPATPIRSATGSTGKPATAKAQTAKTQAAPTQAAFFTDDDELDDELD